MRFRRPQFGLPLLARDLTDQANRARHYILRSAYAGFVFVLGFLYLRDLLLQAGSSGPMSLGVGRELFDRIYNLQLIAVLVFLPALTCGAIAGEKERNTLSVLLTTRLGALTIVLEKLLSRLVVTFMLLAMSSPLLAIAYATGGITLEYMQRWLEVLVALCVLVATISLFCSAWCGSTVSAFFMTYAVAILCCFGTGFAVVSVLLSGTVMLSFRRGVAVMVAAAVVFFAATVACLVRRAQASPRNFLLSFFRALDAFYTQMNVLTGNIVLTRSRATLPVNKPIAWRETAKKSLGTLRYLVRILVSIELPVFLLLALSSDIRQPIGQTGIDGWLWFIVWGIVASLIAVMSGSIISGEQTRQTLAVVLATPIRGDDIVKQLFAGVRRLIFVLWIPLGTIAGYQYWYHLGSYLANHTTPLDRLICALLQMAVYPFLLAWGAFYLGAKIRSPLWTIISSLSGVAGVVLAPYLVAWILQLSGVAVGLPQYAYLASPAEIILLNQFGLATTPVVAMNFLLYGGLVLALRWHCLRHADRLLGRAEMGRRTSPIESPAPLIREEVAAV